MWVNEPFASCAVPLNRISVFLVTSRIGILACSTAGSNECQQLYIVEEPWGLRLLNDFPRARHDRYSGE